VERRTGELGGQTALEQRPNNEAPSIPKTGKVQIDNVLKALGELRPDLTITVHEKQADYLKAGGKKGGAAVYLPEKGEVHINLPRARSNTLFHEAAHVVIHAVLDGHPELLHELYAQLSAHPDFGKYEKFALNYGPGTKAPSDLQKEEAIAEFMADVADGKVPVRGAKDSLWQRFKAWMKALLGRMGFNADRMKLDNPADLRKMAGQFAKAVNEGIKIRGKQAPRMGGVQAQALGGRVNLLSLLTPDGWFKTSSLQSLRDLGRRVQEGEATIRRLDPSEEQGRNDLGRRAVEASVLLGAGPRAGRGHEQADGGNGPGSDVHAQEVARQEVLLEQYARADGSWVEDYPKDVRGRSFMDSGQEAEVFLDKGGKTVTKYIAFNAVDDITPLDFIDRLALHNTLFPDTRYELTGFSRNGLGHFVFQVQQRRITEGEPVTREEVEEYLKDKLDLEPRDSGKKLYSNRFYILDDVHLKNVIKGPDGTLFFIDPIPKLNTPEDGMGGVREYEPLSVHDTPQAFEQRTGLSAVAASFIEDGITDPEAIAKELEDEGRGELIDRVQKEVKAQLAESAGPVEVEAAFNNKPGRILADPIPGTVRNRSEVLKSLQKGVGRVIRFTKTPRRVAGSYLPGSAAVKVRYTGDLDTTAHEIGHALDDQYGLTTRAMDDLAAMHEMSVLSEYGSKPKKNSKDRAKYIAQEGVAEYIRARVVNPSEASRSFPTLTALYDEHVGEQAKAAVSAFSDDIRIWAGASGADKVMSNVDMDPREAKSGVLHKLFDKGDDVALGWVGKLKANWLDPLSAMTKAVDYLKEEGGVDELRPSRDPYMLARLFFHNAGKTNEVLESGMITSKNEVVRDAGGQAKNLNWLLTPLDSSTHEAMQKDMEDTVAYMIAERTVELSGKLEREDVLTGIGAGILTDLAVAKQTLDEAALDEERLTRIKEAATRYREMATHVLEYLKDKGRISQEQFDKINETNLHYVALQRVMEAGPDQAVEVFRSGKGNHLASVAKPVHAIKGSTRRIKNPYDSLLDSINKGIKEADRNEVLQAFTDLMRSGRDMHEGEPENLGKVGVPGKPGDKNSITVFRDGMAETWMLQDDIYKALKGLDNEGYKVPFMLTVPAKVLRWTVTHFPVFAARNIARDLQSRGILTTEGSNLRDLVGNKEHWHEVARAGGLNAGYYLKDDVHYYGLMQEAISQMAKDKRFILADHFKLTKLWKNYETLLYNSETVNRVAEYRAAFRKAKREGMENYDAQLYAAFRSADLIDFALAGHHARVMNQLVPFFNAGVQGLRSGYIHAERDPAGFTVRMALYGILPSLALGLLAAAFGDDDEYEALPAYQRDLFYNMKIGPNKWLAIPKPFELGVPGAFSERLMSYARGNKEAFHGFSGSALQAFFPVDESAMAGPLRTGVELMTNYDFWREKPIVPPYEERLVLDLRDTKGSSRVGQWIQDVAGMDARKADHLIRSSTSYYGNVALKLGDIGRKDGRNKFDLSDLGFFKSSPAYNSAIVTDLTQFATAYGLTSSREFKAFRMYADRYFDAKGDDAKDKAAKELRKAATKAMEILQEKADLKLKEKAKDKK
jgi:hypothetical protein